MGYISDRINKAPSGFFNGLWTQEEPLPLTNKKAAQQEDASEPASPAR